VGRASDVVVAPVVVLGEPGRGGRRGSGGRGKKKRFRRAAPPEATGRRGRDGSRAGKGEAKHPPPNYDVAADKAPTSLRSGVSLQLNAVPFGRPEGVV
jgi:hypothetical protein